MLRHIVPTALAALLLTLLTLVAAEPAPVELTVPAEAPDDVLTTPAPPLEDDPQGPVEWLVEGEDDTLDPPDHTPPATNFGV